MLQEFHDDLDREEEIFLANRFTGENDVDAVSDCSIGSDSEIED